MRAVALLSFVVAVGVVLSTPTPVVGKRIRGMHNALQARAAAVDPLVVALNAKSEPLVTAKPLPYATLRSAFNDNVIRIARAEGSKPRRDIGTFEVFGLARWCNPQDRNDCPRPYYEDPVKGTGTVSAVLNRAAVTRSGVAVPESIDLEFRWGSGCGTATICSAQFTCRNVSRVDLSACERDMRVDLKLEGQSLENPFTTVAWITSLPNWNGKQSGQYWMPRNDAHLSTAGLIVVRNYWETIRGNGYSNRETIQHVRAAWNRDAFNVKPDFMGDGEYLTALAPTVASQVAAAANPNTKRLTTAEILKKFFTSDNIDLARMQGYDVPVATVIGAYTTALFTKLCQNGICHKGWKAQSLIADDKYGGEGYISLSCTVPSDLTKSKCSVQLYARELTFTICDDIGASPAPSPACRFVPQYAQSEKDSSDRWVTTRISFDSSDYATDSVADGMDLYVTNEQLVARWKWHGTKRDRPSIGSALGVQYTDLFALSSSLAAYGVAPTSNCLSKAKADAVIAAAVARGLKSKAHVTLKPEAVTKLIASAPYKSVKAAIGDVLGIGPVNVVFVSYDWNFMC